MHRSPSARRAALAVAFTLILAGCDIEIFPSVEVERIALTINGVVLDADEGGPIQGATASLCGRPGSWLVGGWCGGSVITEADGTFQITEPSVSENVCPLRLTVSAVGYVGTTESPTCTPGAQGMTVRLVPFTSLSVTVTPAVIQVSAGESVQLYAVVTTRFGERVSASVTWSSSTPTIATVDNSGLVTGVAQGETLITADAGGEPGSATVIVKDGSVEPTGPVAYVADNDGITVIDVGTGAVLGAPIEIGAASGLAVDADGDRLFVTAGNFSVLDTQTRAVVSTTSLGGGARNIAIAPDGSRAYVTNDVANTITVIDLSTYVPIKSIPARDGTFGIAITPDGERAVVSAYKSQDVSVVDLAGDSLIGPPISMEPRPQGLALTPDGKRAYVAELFNRSVVVVDLDAHAKVGSPIGVGTFPSEVAITPDGARAYVTNMSSNDVSVIDIATNTVIATIEVGSGALGVAFTPDGSVAVVTCPNADYVVRIDVATSAIIGVPIGVGRFPGPIVISP